MTEMERLILLHQFDILARLNPDDDYYTNGVEILSNGYEFLYSEITDRLYEPMPENEGKFVIDVLQMHRSLAFSFAKLTDKEDLTERDVAFRGFDGNEEGRYYSFAKFYIKDFGRYNELRENDYNSYNSHSNRISKYRRMLKVWETISERYNNDLTVEQIKSIINE